MLKTTTRVAKELYPHTQAQDIPHQGEAGGETDITSLEYNVNTLSIGKHSDNNNEGLFSLKLDYI